MEDLNKLLRGTTENCSGIFILVSHKTALAKVTKRLSTLLPFDCDPSDRHHHTYNHGGVPHHNATLLCRHRGGPYSVWIFLIDPVNWICTSTLFTVWQNASIKFIKSFLKLRPLKCPQNGLERNIVRLVLHQITHHKKSLQQTIQ
jgi:hypothetical protein